MSETSFILESDNTIVYAAAAESASVSTGDTITIDKVEDSPEDSMVTVWFSGVDGVNRYLIPELSESNYTSLGSWTLASVRTSLTNYLTGG